MVVVVVVVGVGGAREYVCSLKGMCRYLCYVIVVCSAFVNAYK